LNILLWILFLPSSWENPIIFLIKTLRHFSQNYYENYELYLGKFVPSMHLPWHYLPVWIFISTPILYTVLFFVGVFFLIKHFRINGPDQIYDYVVLGIFTISFLLPICLHSTLYTGWRHFYFLYGPFLYLSIVGLSALLAIKNTILKSVVWGISIGSIIFNGAWMIRNHPYQMVYFNVLVRDKAPYNFERDYWGASSSECLRFIVSQTDDLRIHVGDYDAGLLAAKFSLKKSDRERIVDDSFGYDANRMKYLILNYTRVIGNEKKILFYEPVYKIQSDGMNIATVFERKDRDGVWANAIVKDVTSNVNPQLTPLIFDPDDQTGWSTERFQQKGDYLLFELKEATKLYGISILTSTERYETPQELRIEGSENGTDWVTLPLTYQTHSDYAFSPVNIKYIKLILEQNSDEIAWTVNDVMFHLASNE
ncbi:MAG TPA: discoidin domain-containing protein, partial [Flexilinea sp.]|nr:discoidin domain-containing protein [Flexilinea sp.]